VQKVCRLLAHDTLAPAIWQQIVADAVASIRSGVYEKVVLARSVKVTRPEEPFEVEDTLMRLRESYPGAYVFAFQRGSRYFVGATPERLIFAHDGQLRTMALAGSYPRGATEKEDQRLGAELLHSAKNKQEHEFVVAQIRTALADLCSKVWIADAPHLLRLKNIQHLETPIFGELLPGRCVLEALEGLHPTPAVGGLPQHAALEAIREHEQLDRGWYAGPVGWVDAQGNGEFAVALRSALVEGDSAMLFAGCGIVADSNPESEYTESCWKLQVMLRGLGGEDCEM
jgi:isochorismate synthase